MNTFTHGTIHACTAVSYPSLFSRTMPSNTLLLIPNEFGTVFELGIQRLETLEQLEIPCSQALASHIFIAAVRSIET